MAVFKFGPPWWGNGKFVPPWWWGNCKFGSPWFSIGKFGSPWWVIGKFGSPCWVIGKFGSPWWWGNDKFVDFGIEVYGWKAGSGDMSALSCKIQGSHTSQMRKFKGISKVIKGSTAHFQGYFWKTVVTLLYVNKISSNFFHLFQDFF